MKISFLDAQTLGEDINLEILSSLGDFHSYSNTSRSEIIDRSKDSDILIVNKVKLDATLLVKLPKLKLICVAATGMDNIDVEYANSKAIKVMNVRGYSTESVVQHTFTMLFYLLGQTRHYDNYVQSEQWVQSSSFTHLDYPFWELSGKQLAIIGLGTIGKRVASIASAFGCRVVYYSTSGKNNDSAYERYDLDTIMRTSDIVTIHAPLNENTRNLISRTELEKLKENSILLNLGRGGIINEKDLGQSIKNQKIFVGLDVIEQEPMSASSPLRGVLSHEGLLITPHIAWSSIEARTRLLDGIVKNIKSFIN